jgi:hypothetical protein
VCLSVKVLKPISLLIKLSPRTRGPKNYSGPRVLTSYFYVCFRATTARGPYFLLLFLRPFSCNNCRRWWGRYFWDLEGGWGDLGALFLGQGFKRVIIFIFFVEGGWGWGSRGLNRWKWTRVKNAKDRVGGINEVHYAPGSH